MSAVKLDVRGSRTLASLGPVWVALLCMMVVVVLPVGAAIASQFGMFGVTETQEVITCLAWVVSNDNGTPDSVSPYGVLDRVDNGGGTEYDYWGPLSSNDPSGVQTRGQACDRYTKDVARTTAAMVDCRHIEVTMENAYPCYYPTIFFGIRNMGNVPSIIQSIEIDENAYTPTIDAIDELTVSIAGVHVGQVLPVGTEAVGTLTVHLEQCAAQDTTYTFRVTITTMFWNQEGTLGFWKNWQANKKYTKDQIDAWLRGIDQNSRWLGPTTTDRMVALIDAATSKKATMSDKFLAQYLCLRLDVTSWRLSIEMPRNVTAYDAGNYLGLAHPESASLAEILVAIEGKYGTSPTAKQLSTMMTLCDALNNAKI